MRYGWLKAPSTVSRRFWSNSIIFPNRSSARGFASGNSASIGTWKSRVYGWSPSAKDQLHEHDNNPHGHSTPTTTTLTDTARRHTRTLGRWGISRICFSTDSLEMPPSSSGRGDPSFSMISRSWSLVEEPRNSGLRPRISANMQPTLQTSTPVPYVSLSHNSSGARYHRVTTYSVSFPVVWSIRKKRTTDG